MMAVNQFGNFEFVSFHRVEDRAAPPEILAQQTETVQRPGSDGTGVINLGRKGTAFQMRSFVDTTSQAAAVQLAKLYKGCIGTGPYGIIWGGANYTDLHDVVYVPLEVQIIKVKQLRACAGGIYPPSLGGLEAIWTLQPIQIPAE